jgi:protein ImuA
MNSSAAEKILALRATLARAEAPAAQKHVSVPLGHPGADACLKGGFLCGALHEVFADAGHEGAASGFTAALAFRTAANRRVLWIRQDFSALEFGELAATGFLELGLDPERLLLLRMPDAAGVLRAACDALSCEALGAVVMEIPGEPGILHLVASRRLTLASAQKGVTAFLLRFNAAPETSTAETRWHISAARSVPEDEIWGLPIFQADLVRNRHGQTGHWVMEWDCEDGHFREPRHEHAADSRTVVSTSAN